MSDATDLQLIEAYIARRDHLKKLAEQFAASTKPFQDQMNLIENEMLKRLNERGADHSSTEAGTAMKVRNTSVKCADKPAFLDWVYANWTTARDMLTAAVSKETLNLYVDKTKSAAHPDGQLPPGITITPVISVNFRRS